jgi:hypothetical protein
LSQNITVHLQHGEDYIQEHQIRVLPLLTKKGKKRGGNILSGSSVIGSILIFTQPGITVSLLILSGLEKKNNKELVRLKLQLIRSFFSIRI